MKQIKYQISLPVSFIREGDSFIAYTPALDLSTAGDSFEEAKARFEEVVGIFFEEIAEKGTAEEVLLELGWQRVNKELTPPVIIAHQSEQFTIPLTI